MKKILGIGAAVVDHIHLVDEAYVAALEGGKGGMELIDHKSLDKILGELGPASKIVAGGSAANVVKGLASLGSPAAFLSTVGEDAVGAMFLDELKALGIASHCRRSSTPTAQSLCLVTPDGERTMRTFLGAGREMSACDLKQELFADTGWLHLEGYCLAREELVEKAVAMAGEAGARISLDLSSYEVVRSYKKRLEKILKESVDMVVANADEGWALTGLPPKEACAALKELCDVAILLFGAEGCWVGHSGKLFHGPAFPAHPLDSTGAGDLFTSGFLHGYLEGRPLEECARLGALAGSAVVKVFGAELSQEEWKRVFNSLK